MSCGRELSTDGLFLAGFCALSSHSSRHYPRFKKLCQFPLIDAHCHLRSLSPFLFSLSKGWPGLVPNRAHRGSTF